MVSFFYAPVIFMGGWVGWGGGGGHIVSPLSVRTSIPSVTQMVSVQYLLKILVYWIEIYTQVYNYKM